LCDFLLLLFEILSCDGWEDCELKWEFDSRDPVLVFEEDLELVDFEIPFGREPFPASLCLEGLAELSFWRLFLPMLINWNR